jgi:SAM-dependent methyltransferase
MSKRWDTLAKMHRERGTRETATFLASRLHNLITRGTLSPPNTIPANREIWSRWDWSTRGEEWTGSSQFKTGILDNILFPNIPARSRVLEVGPGAGRWTEFLLKLSKHLILVDLTPECIRLCQERFANATNTSYFVNDGKDLSFVPPASIECIWSFDVFVHIQSSDVDDYVRQFATILTPGGRAIIHHSAKGATAKHWRSDMTTERMAELCSKHGLKVIDQRSAWGDFKINAEGRDVVTIFERPMAEPAPSMGTAGNA